MRNAFTMCNDIFASFESVALIYLSKVSASVLFRIFYENDALISRTPDERRLQKSAIL